MYLVVASKPNGDVTYFGPFPNKRRAMEYGDSIQSDSHWSRWHIVPLVVPNCIGCTVNMKY